MNSKKAGSDDLNNPGAQLAVTFTADLIFGRVLTLRECANKLREFNREAVSGMLVFLKHLNENIFLDRTTQPKKWEYHFANFINEFFDDNHRPNALKIVNEHIDCIQPLSDQAILAMLELSISVCPLKSGSEIGILKDRQSLIWILLSFQSDLLSPAFQNRVGKIKSNLEITESESSEFICNHLAHNTAKYYRHSLARLYAFCCIPEISISLSDWFKTLLGVEPEMYFVIACLLLGPAYRLNIDHPNPSNCDRRE